MKLFSIAVLISLISLVGAQAHAASPFAPKKEINWDKVGLKISGLFGATIEKTMKVNTDAEQILSDKGLHVATSEPRIAHITF